MKHSPVKTSKIEVIALLVAILCLAVAAFMSYSSSISQKPGKGTVRREHQTKPVSQTERSMAIVEQATVFIMCMDGRSSGMRTGTGFFIGPDTIMTNRHVVEKARKILVGNHFLPDLLPAGIIATGKSKLHDFAVLKVKAKGTKSTVRPLAFTENIRRAETVNAWGYPGMLLQFDPHLKKGRSAPEVIFSSGEVNAVHRDNPSRIIHTAVIARGNSGGPLVNHKGQVVGINTYLATDKVSNTHFAIAIASADIISFLRGNGIGFIKGD